MGSLAPISSCIAVPSPAINNAPSIACVATSLFCSPKLSSTISIGVTFATNIAKICCIPKGMALPKGGMPSDSNRLPPFLNTEVIPLPKSAKKPLMTFLQPFSYIIIHILLRCKP